MQESVPIFIPSKGRAHCNRGTLHNLIAAGINATVVVEPHEEQKYSELVESLVRQRESEQGATGSDATARGKWKVVALPLSEQGVSYARNYILQTLSPKSGWYWVMDDDIRDFYKADGKKNQKITPGEMLATVMERAQLYPEVAMFSLEYAVFAYSYSDAHVAFNSYNNIAVLFNKTRLPPQLEYRWRIREDYDFTLQLIRAGGQSVRFRNLSFNVPRMAEVKGGMTDFYETKKKEIREANTVFVAEWPSVSREVVKGTGSTLRYDIQVKWTLLNPAKCPNPVALLNSKVPLPPAPGPALKRDPAPGNRKRGRVSRVSSCTTSDSEELDEEDSTTVDESSSEEGSAEVSRRRRPRATVKRERPPKAPAPPREKCLPGWKGYQLEEWRNVPDDVATTVIGLQKLEPSDVKLGLQCAIIPVWTSVPQNLVVVTVIGVVRRAPAYEWTGVVEKCRGVPLQTFGTAFAVPHDLMEKDAAIGLWLNSPPQVKPAEVTEGSAESLHDHNLNGMVK